MDQTTDLGTIGVLLGSTAYFTNLTVSGITMAFPKRASWVAFVSALVLGVFYAALLSIANGLLLQDLLTGHAVAQVLLVGIAAGGTAGASISQTSADKRRQDSTSQEPSAAPAPAHVGSVAAANG